jgi:protein involved in polysaccharide export with SLBB domain
MLPWRPVACSKHILAVGILAFAFACRTAQVQEVKDVSRPAVDASLGPGDVFEVRVFEEPDLSGTYRVEVTGEIDFPLIGKVSVAGRLPGEIADELRARLRTYVRSPQVSVLVKEATSKHVIVYGQVQHPGTFTYTDAMTVAQAISLAGGFTAMAARDKVRISRIQNRKQLLIQIDLRAIADGRDPNQYVAPGDEVFVPDRLF